VLWPNSIVNFRVGVRSTVEDASFSVREQSAASSPSYLKPCKYDEAVRRNDDVCGGLQSVQRRAGRIDASSIACNNRVYPVIVDIAVENLAPRTGKMENRYRSCTRCFLLAFQPR
jgi:hypothetical protein